MDEFIGIASEIEATSKGIPFCNFKIFVIMFMIEINRCRARVQNPEGMFGKHEINFIDLVHNHEPDDRKPSYPFML